ncbi:hypothetical protein M9Y10_001792 [Tritrichomonas musculus]|uniref:Transmembrane protein n=1 Tax=Tritrichomonas musculus TaxID=1915356 RepID=A0ABR2L8Z8_9EUKA
MHHLKNIPEITINFGQINQYIFWIIIFFIALIIGKSSYTDVYDKFNQLPDDRNELTPIKKMIASIVNGSELYVRVSFDAITRLTIENLLQNINARVEYEDISFTISSKNSDSKTIQSDFFEFSYKLPYYGTNVSLQLFLIDTPINAVQFFDVVKTKNNDDFQSFTTFNSKSFTNVCAYRNKIQLFFKGKPDYNLKKLKIPTFNDYSDFSYLKERSDHIQQKAILIYSDQDQVNQDYFSETTSAMYEYFKDQTSEVQKFIYNSQDLLIFQNLFEFNNIFSDKKYCFSNLEILHPSFDDDVIPFLKDKISKEIKSKKSSFNQDGHEKPLSFLSHEGSSIEKQDELFQAICPNCDVNTISTSRSSIETSDLNRIANSKVIIGFHSKWLLSAISMQNIDQESVIIDILPTGLQECGNWVKNMSKVAKTIIYSVTNGNMMYQRYCSKEDCDDEKCTSLLNGNFHIDADQILKVIKTSTGECPYNLFTINQTGVFCIKY